MDIRNRRVRALILKSAPYREQDRLLDIFSLEGGRERIIAKGAEKLASSLRAVSQAYSQAELLLTPPRGGLSFLAGGSPVQSFLSPSGGLERYAAAAYIAELALAALPERRPGEALYGLLLAAFSLLKMDDDFSRTLRLFELRLLRELGLLPETQACGRCGARLRGEGFILSPRAGQLLCPSCGQEESGPSLSAGAVLTMNKLLTLALDKLPGLKLTPAISQ